MHRFNSFTTFLLGIRTKFHASDTDSLALIAFLLGIHNFNFLFSIYNYLNWHLQLFCLAFTTFLLDFP